MCSKAARVQKKNRNAFQGESHPSLARSIQAVFIESFTQYAQNHPLPLHYHKAAQHIMDCRTAALGGHTLYCEEGHLDGIWYNSCRHRFCPQCQGINLMRWVEKQEARLLDCTHHHITFTIPHEYQAYWRLNTELMMDLLFRAVKETLTDFLVTDPDRKYLDAVPGFILALHTWGRDLSLHPHIHCIITDGGLNSSGQWVTPKGSCFLPIRAVMKKFRGKLNDFIRITARKEKNWLYPEGSNEQQLINLTNKLGRKKWNVHIKAGFKSSKPLLSYLVNYLKGGPLKNTAIISVTPGSVTFRYYPHKENPDGKKEKGRLMNLTHEQFFERYLPHIPPPGKQLIRKYGLYSNGQTKKLNQSRIESGQCEIDPSSGQDYKTWEECLSQFETIKTKTHCKICGKPLTVKKPIPRWMLSADEQQKAYWCERSPPEKQAA